MECVNKKGIRYGVIRSEYVNDEFIKNCMEKGKTVNLTRTKALVEYLSNLEIELVALCGMMQLTNEQMAEFRELVENYAKERFKEFHIDSVTDSLEIHTEDGYNLILDEDGFLIIKAAPFISMVNLFPDGDKFYNLGNLSYLGEGDYPAYCLAEEVLEKDDIKPFSIKTVKEFEGWFVVQKKPLYQK